MFRFSLRKLIVVVAMCSLLFAVIGLVYNQGSERTWSFLEGKRFVRIIANKYSLRGTFVQIETEENEVLTLRQISYSLVPPHKFVSCSTTSNHWLKAFYYDNPNPLQVDILILLDLNDNGFAVYWSGCRAERCLAKSWETWDAHYLMFASELQQKGFDVSMTIRESEATKSRGTSN